MFEQMRFKLVVVMYKLAWEESQTLVSLVTMDVAKCNVELVVWDNSPTSTYNQTMVNKLSEKLQSVKFIHSPKNTPLSSIYNDEMAGIDQEAFLILLDHDTSLPPDYLQQIMIYSDRFPQVDLFLPIVWSAERIVSPGSYFLVKGRHWKTERRGIIPSNNTVAITSAMAIRGRYLAERPRIYNEQLSFYGIDTAFMLDYARHRPFLCVMDISILHDCAMWSGTDQANMLERFRNERASWLVIHRRPHFKLILAILFAAYSSLRNATRHLDWRYLR